MIEIHTYVYIFQFPVAAGTKYHKVDGLEQHKFYLTVLEARIWDGSHKLWSRCWQSCTPSKGSGEEPVSLPSQLPEAPASLDGGPFLRLKASGLSPSSCSSQLLPTSHLWPSRLLLSLIRTLVMTLAPPGQPVKGPVKEGQKSIQGTDSFYIIILNFSALVIFSPGRSVF